MARQRRSRCLTTDRPALQIPRSPRMPGSCALEPAVRSPGRGHPVERCGSPGARRPAACLQCWLPRVAEARNSPSVWQRSLRGRSHTLPATTTRRRWLLLLGSTACSAAPGCESCSGSENEGGNDATSKLPVGSTADPQRPCHRTSPIVGSWAVAVRHVHHAILVACHVPSPIVRSEAFKYLCHPERPSTPYLRNTPPRGISYHPALEHEIPRRGQDRDGQLTG